LPSPNIGVLDPDSPGKPFVVGNCQAGWHAMMAAGVRPDLVGPVLIAGAPLSSWAGVLSKNPMRDLGGMPGGSWLARLTSDQLGTSKGSLGQEKNRAICPGFPPGKSVTRAPKPKPPGLRSIFQNS